MNIDFFLIIYFIGIDLLRIESVCFLVVQIMLRL